MCNSLDDVFLAAGQMPAAGDFIKKLELPVRKKVGARLEILAVVLSGLAEPAHEYAAMVADHGPEAIEARLTDVPPVMPTVLSP